MFRGTFTTHRALGLYGKTRNHQSSSSGEITYDILLLIEFQTKAELRTTFSPSIACTDRIRFLFDALFFCFFDRHYHITQNI